MAILSFSKILSLDVSVSPELAFPWWSFYFFYLFVSVFHSQICDFCLFFLFSLNFLKQLFISGCLWLLSHSSYSPILCFVSGILVILFDILGLNQCTFHIEHPYFTVKWVPTVLSSSKTLFCIWLSSTPWLE